MSYYGTRDKTRLRSDSESFGQYVTQPALPDAIRSLDDEELRTLLLALLYEWRSRTGGGQEGNLPS